MRQAVIVKDTFTERIKNQRCSTHTQHTQHTPFYMQCFVTNQAIKSAIAVAQNEKGWLVQLNTGISFSQIA